MFKVFAGTSKGKRDYQQDCFVCGDFISSDMPASYFTYREYDEQEPAILFAVFDGMGGMEGGEIASSAGAELLYKQFESEYTVNTDPEIFLKNTADLINEKIISLFLDKQMAGGTTIAALLIYKDDFYFINIGDSQAFFCKGCESIEEISYSHNLAQHRMKQGIMPSKEDRRILLHSLGDNNSSAKASDIAHMFKCSFKPGDALILCSDGITDSISLRKILGAASKKNIKKAGRKLVQKAAAAEDADNSTLIMIKKINEGKIWSRRK